MIFRPFFIPAPTFSTPPKTIQRFNDYTLQHSYIPTFLLFHSSFLIFWACPSPQAASGRAIRSYSPHTNGWFCFSVPPFP